MEFFINLSITDILSSWELQSASVLAAKKTSSLLVILYAIASRKTNEGCFFAAFFVDEILSNLSVLNFLDEYQYYLVIASIYCVLYWHIENKRMKLNTLVACGIIVLFNAGMSIDAIINKEVYSFLFTYYLPIVVLVHLYFIGTLFKWKNARASLGAYLRGFSRLLGHNYNFAFVWYTIKKEVYPSEAKA